MSTTEIEKKQELLKIKKRELISRCFEGFAIVAVYLVVALSLVYFFAGQSVILSAIPISLNLGFFSLFGIWSNAKITPIAKEIRELKTEIKEATAAQWRDETISKIRSGEISPV